jgi:hypothetical protein
MNPSTQTRRRTGWRIDTRVLAIAAAVAPLAAASHAHAQAGSPSVVIAEKLFREGQQLLEASKTDDSKTHAACEKFAESERLRPALGTLLNLAVCHEKEKKTASAWAEYTEVAGQATRAGQADRATFAQQHAAALEHSLCRLRLEMSAPPLNTEVRIDGQPLGTAIWGTDIPLDPGSHAIVVAAPGKQPWSRTITLGPDQTMDREEVPPLLDDTTAHPAVAGGVDAHGALQPDPAGSDKGKGSTGYILGGVGVAALAVGGIFIGRGAAFSSQGSDESTKAAAFTAMHDTTNAANYSAASSSDKSAGTTNIIVGAVAGGVGLVGIGVGLYFILASPSKEAPAKPTALRVLPDVGPGRAGASLGYSF